MSSHIDARAAGDAAMLRLAGRSEWQQVMLVGADRHRLAPAGFARLAAGLEEAEAAGAITGYHFLRKDGGLRLRVAPDEEQARRTIDRILDSLTTYGEISEWARGVYEPEVYAFGGPAAMDIAHRLFCADSRAALAAAGRADRRRPGPRETATLLVSALLRAAGLDCDGTDDTRRRVERARLVAESTDPAGVEKVLNALIEARLVTIDETTVTIVHEILLRAWPRLRQWIDADREGLLLQQRLAEATEVWDRDGRHESDLYRGHRLAAFRERLDAADPHFPALTSEFLRASVTGSGPMSAALCGGAGCANSSRCSAHWG